MSSKWPMMRLPNGQIAPSGWALVDAIRTTLRLINKQPDPALDPDRKLLLDALLRCADNDPIAGPTLAAEVQSIFDYESARTKANTKRLDKG